jgi:hypothetical protein
MFREGSIYKKNVFKKDQHPVRTVFFFHDKTTPVNLSAAETL